MTAPLTSTTLMIVPVVLVVILLAGVGANDVGRARWSRRRVGELRGHVVDDRSGVSSSATVWRRRLRRWSRPAAAFVGALVALAVLGPFASIVVAALVVAARRANTLVAERRTRLRIEASAPDAVELFVLLTHAGLTPVQAVRELSSTAPGATQVGFCAVVHRLERGEPFADALAALPARLGSCMIGLADTVASADRYGSPLAPMLESLALEARAARRRRSEADARRLPIRLSFPLVMCTLPSFVLLAIAPAVIAALSSISVPI